MLLIVVVSIYYCSMLFMWSKHTNLLWLTFVGPIDNRIEFITELINLLYCFFFFFRIVSMYLYIVNKREFQFLLYLPYLSNFKLFSLLLPIVPQKSILRSCLLF